MTARPKPDPRAVTIAEIGQQFELASYWFGAKWCPAVHQNSDGRYGIRIVRSQSITLGSQTVSYDYFELDADGTITTAPRGYAKEFRPGRVTDIAAALDRFATPPEGAMRINLGGAL